MVRRLFLMLIGVIGITPVFSQKTAIFTEADRTYRLGLELLEKQKYGAARKAFEQTIQSTETVSLEARSNSCFYVGLCSAELFNPDAEYLLMDFLKRYPENPLVTEAKYTLANSYYRSKKFKKALEWYSQLDGVSFPETRRDEVNFKTGYSAYMSEDYDKASRAFFAVKDKDCKYATAARYYYAHMAYVSKNYETALKEFMKLRDSEAFAPIAPYYITQIYYKQGKFDEVLKYAPKAIDTAGTRNGLEISRMIAESHFRQGNYAEAIRYLTDYEKNSPNTGTAEFYELGYSYYRTNKYDNAIPYFKKLTTVEDSIAQNAFYHLADCYIHSNDKRSARIAYQAAARMSFDPFITEESQFAFAKLSYELSFQSVAIESIQTFLKDHPESIHVAEANEMLVTLYAGTRNYKGALSALEAIKTKTPGMRAAYQKAAYYRGVELFMDNKPSDALKLFQLSLDNPSEPKLTAEANYWKGEAAYKLGQYEHAYKSYGDFLSSPGAISTAHYNLANYNAGYAAFKQENYTAAQTAFRKYIKDKSATDPERYADALMRTADCYFILRDQVAALEYYNQAIQVKSKSTDYALYQKSIILGVQGKLQDKITTLDKLIDEYPGSTYLDDALFENAQAYLTIGNNSRALTDYDRVITQFPNSSYVKKAELGKALVYYNDGKDEQATAACKRIIKTYPNTVESREALMQLKNIAVNQHKVDDYLEYVKDVPNADVSSAAKDSLVYMAAEMLYTQGKCDDAVRDFEAYLDKFPNAIFLVNANYYKSDCLYRAKKYDEALPGYEIVIGQPRNSFTEKALVNAASINYRQKQYDRAYAEYEVLEKNAEVKENITVARIGQMRCAARLAQCDKAVSAAGRILAAESIDKDIQNEAQLVTGRCLLKAGDLEKAKAAFTVVAKRTNSEMTAESKYSLALIEYKNGNYKESQKLIFEVQKQVPSYDFWIAKSFILLGDDYLALKDTFQARETYKSIVENYEKDANDQEDLKAIAQEKLDAVVDAERKQEREEKGRKSQPLQNDSLEISPIK